MYKKIRMEWINEDIENSLFHEEEYQAIKNRYLNAETEEDWEKVIVDHDDLTEKEAKQLLKMATVIKKIKIGEVN